MLIPEENAKDLVDVNESIKSGLNIIPVSRMDEVLAHALVRKPEPIVWDELSGRQAGGQAGGRWLGPDRALRPRL